MGIITFGFSDKNVDIVGSEWSKVIHSIRHIEAAVE
jgi:hypothetical protein